MSNAETHITKQGSVPLSKELREKLGFLPGTRVECLEENGSLVIRRAGGHTSRDIHDAVFEEAPASRSVQDMDHGIQDIVTRKHARDRWPTGVVTD